MESESPLEIEVDKSVPISRMGAGAKQRNTDEQIRVHKRKSQTMVAKVIQNVNDSSEMMDGGMGEALKTPFETPAAASQTIVSGNGSPSREISSAPKKREPEIGNSQKIEIVDDDDGVSLEMGIAIADNNKLKSMKADQEVDHIIRLSSTKEQLII